MIGFVLRFLKGIILGWIVSLMLFLVKRMLSKAFGVNIPQAPQNSHNPHPSSQNTYTRPTANQNSLDVVEAMWVGMSVDQLRRSFGWPLQKETTAGGEIWVYNNLNGQGIQTHVAIQNDVVTGWQDQPMARPHSAP